MLNAANETAVENTASTDVTALVTLFCGPVPIAVTFTVNVHVALAARVAPVKLTLLDAATAVIVPPPQLPINPRPAPASLRRW